MAINLTIPQPTQIIIDDVGWWRGADDNTSGGPFRTGMARDHVPADYAAIVELGRRLGMRPMAATILCEWDRDNILCNLPDSTWMGANWDNSEIAARAADLDEAAAIIRDNPDHIEIALHGVGHEYWGDGTMSRAEWFDLQGNMRPRESVLRHIEFYRRLMERNGLGGFPESFVPAAFLYRFGMGDGGFAGILRDAGIRYASTPFYSMFRDRLPEVQFFGMDAGILMVDRGRDLARWNIASPTPQSELQGPICGMHWPNILHIDPSRNVEVVDRWVAFLKKQAAKPDRMLSRNTAESFSQLVYHELTSVTIQDGFLHFDFSRVDAVGSVGLLDCFHVKIPSSHRLIPEAPHVSVELRQVTPEVGLSLWKMTRLTPGVASCALRLDSSEA